MDSGYIQKLVKYSDILHHTQDSNVSHDTKSTFYAVSLKHIFVIRAISFFSIHKVIPFSFWKAISNEFLMEEQTNPKYTNHICSK